VTTTLAVVLFTIVILGGGTLPLLKLLKVPKSVVISKTRNMEKDDDSSFSMKNTLNWFERLNIK
jgi:hypothetical protein